jgi:hypothetical protein
MSALKCCSFCLILLCLLCGASAEAYTIAFAGNGLGTKWEPGGGAASFFNPALPPGTPGGATWSLMPDGIQISLGDLAPYHNSNFFSTGVAGVTGLPDVDGVPYEIWAMNDALNKWAGVSGFTNLGQVADGSPNGSPGCDDAYNGCVDEGDIRIGAYAFNPVSGTVITAHTFQPGTTALDPPYGSIGGDLHLNNDQNSIYPNQLTWVDDPFDLYANDTIDFYTVVLHELGHALGLGHSEDDTSVMAMYPDRGYALRDLTPDDIAGIQAIYGPEQVVPEPGSLVLLSLGLGGLALAAWRKRK